MDNHSYIVVSIMGGGHLLVNMRMKINLLIVVLPSYQCCRKHDRPEIFLVALWKPRSEKKVYAVTFGFRAIAQIKKLLLLRNTNM